MVKVNWLVYTPYPSSLKNFWASIQKYVIISSEQAYSFSHIKNQI